MNICILEVTDVIAFKELRALIVNLLHSEMFPLCKFYNVCKLIKSKGKR